MMTVAIENQDLERTITNVAQSEGKSSAGIVRDARMRQARRRQLLAAAGSIITAVGVLHTRIAQAQTTAPRVVLVIAGSVRTQPERVNAFRNRLREPGYTEGKNLTLEIRELQGRNDQLPKIMAEVVASKPAIIVAHGLGVHAAHAATKTIPIVAALTSDPVKEGIAASLARPGGNVTGNTLILSVSSEKTVEIAHEIVPAAKRIGMLSNPDTASFEANRKLFEAAAAKRRLTPVVLTATTLQDIPKAITGGVAQRIDALIVATQDLFVIEPQVITDLVARLRLPTVYSVDPFIAAGGLVVNGFNSVRLFANAATIVDRILEGRSPAELPFEQPTQIEMVVNLKTAKVLGLKIPYSIMVRADRVIE